MTTPRWQIVYAMVACGLIGGFAAYGLCDALAWPRLTYFPYDGTWAMRAGAPPPGAMGYYGVVLWGLGGGVVGAAIGAIGARAWRRPLPSAAITLLGAWALAAGALTALYYVWSLAPF
jgi:hypothetical protein